MKGTDRTRPLGEYGSPEGGPRIVRVRGVSASPSNQWRRLKFTLGIGYEATSEALTIYEPGSLSAKPVAINEEHWVIWRPAAARYEVFATGDTGNIIYAQVNGSITSGDPTGLFDNAIAIVGTAPVGGAGTFQNQFAQDYSDNAPVLLFQRKDNLQWLTERGGESGSQVTVFRLTADKSYAATAVTAKPVQADGTVDAGAAQVRLIDFEHQFWGKGPYTDADAEATVWPGYLAIGVRFVDDWAATGDPGFVIIAMEGPAQWLRVTLKENIGATNPDEAKANYVGSQDFRGRPFSNRRPRLENTSAAGNFTVFDDLDKAQSAKSGEDWIVKWSEDGQHYLLWERLASRFGVVSGTTTTTVAPTDVTFQINNLQLIQGELPPFSTLTVDNIPPIRVANGTVVEARYNFQAHATDEDKRWDTGTGGNFDHHARGKENYVADVDHPYQVFAHNQSGVLRWMDTTLCNVSD